MQKEGPESKTHSLFVVLQKSLSEVRAVTSKGKVGKKSSLLVGPAFWTAQFYLWIIMSVNYYISELV